MKTTFITLSLLIASVTTSVFAAHASDGAISGNDPSIVVAQANVAAPSNAPVAAPAQETIVQRVPVAPETGAASSDWYCEYQQYCFVNYNGYYICQWRQVCM